MVATVLRLALLALTAALLAVPARAQTASAPSRGESAARGATVRPAVAPASSRATPFKSADAIGRWINTYRSKPEPQRLPALVQAMGQLNMLSDQEASGLYLGFIGGVLAANPAAANDLVARMFPLPPEHHAALIKAVAYSGLPGWRDLLRQNAERMPSRVVLIDRYVTGRIPALDGLQLDAGPVPLDVLWGNYYATGSYEPIVRIISVLKWSKNENDVERLTVGSMAKWTLATNASRDVDLLRLLKTGLTHEPASTERLLNEVIEAAETGETSKIRKEALTAIEQLKAKGPANTRNVAWWGQAGQMALALGCVTASALGATAAIGIPCVIGGAASTAALKAWAPQ